MPQETDSALMVKYQFEIDDEEWEEWKNTVPRSKSLEQRIIELIKADSEGRVQPPQEDDIAASDSSPEGGDASDDAGEATYQTFDSDEDPHPDARVIQGEQVSLDVIDDETEARLREALDGSGDLLDARVNEILKMYQELKRRGEATGDELLSVVDVGAAEYQDEESVWSNMVKGKDTLRGLPGVQKPSTGKSTWKYTGDDDE